MSLEKKNETEKTEIIEKSKKALIDDDALENISGGYGFTSLCAVCHLPKSSCKCQKPSVEII